MQNLEEEPTPGQPHELLQRAKGAAIDELGMIGHIHAKFVNVVIHMMSLKSLDVNHA
ncbi:MAG: hypothetical protein ACKPKO_25365 [Candidatus Fonsibacter sp.]